jgi:hypothetical protein
MRLARDDENDEKRREVRAEGFSIELREAGQRMRVPTGF